MYIYLNILDVFVRSVEGRACCRTRHWSWEWKWRLVVSGRYVSSNQIQTRNSNSVIRAVQSSSVEQCFSV